MRICGVLTSMLPQETRVRLMSIGLAEQEAEVLMTVDAGRTIRQGGRELVCMGSITVLGIAF